MRLAILLLAALSSFCVAQPKFYYPVPSDSQIEIRKDVAYAKSGGKDLALDLYRPAGLPANLRAPLVIFMNAAGGSQRPWPIYTGWAKAATAVGFAAINADPPEAQDAREAAFDSLLDYVAKNSADLR